MKTLELSPSGVSERNLKGASPLERYALRLVHEVGRGRTGVFLRKEGGEEVFLGWVGYLGHSPEASRLFYVVASLVEYLVGGERMLLSLEEEFPGHSGGAV